jgi:hypothetical protein
MTDSQLREMATYADGMGPWKGYIVTVLGVDANGDAKPTREGRLHSQ